MRSEFTMRLIPTVEHSRVQKIQSERVILVRIFFPFRSLSEAFSSRPFPDSGKNYLELPEPWDLSLALPFLRVFPPNEI